jgi:hypothetical protein
MKQTSVRKTRILAMDEEEEPRMRCRTGAAEANTDEHGLPRTDETKKPDVRCEKSDVRRGRDSRRLRRLPETAEVRRQTSE